MKKLFSFVYCVLLSAMLFAASVHQNSSPPNTTPTLTQESTVSPCVKAFLDGQEIDNENLNKDSEGTLEVENQVFFNLVLKSHVGSEKPPIYLRFQKVDRLDIQRVLKYAKIGDEIFIEPFSLGGFKCLPSHFIVT